MNLVATNDRVDSANKMGAARRRPLPVPSPRRDNGSYEKAFCRVQLFLGLVLTVFIAGIVVPSLVRSVAATREALDAGSLHMIKVAGITFLYAYKNLVAAILGVLVGGAAALVLEVERARFWLRHVCEVSKVCLQHWVFGVHGRSPASYITARMSRQPVPLVDEVRLAVMREKEADLAER